MTSETPTIMRRTIISPAEVLERRRAGLPATVGNELELRVATVSWADQDIELRADGDGLSFRGYAAVFDSWSENLGGFREKIRPGAFARSLREKRTLKMFLNHNEDIVLASTRKGQGTLRLTEDERGLLAEAELPDNEWGRPVRDAIRRRDIDSMSFGFEGVKDSWDKLDEDTAERELIELRLWEVSPVTGWPAYTATNAAVRAIAEEIGTEPDELAAAFAVLRTDEKLTTEQHSLLIRALNARYDEPVIAKSLAGWQARFAAKGLT
jgi:hypothetical protein